VPGLILAALGFYMMASGVIGILFVRWLYWAIESFSPALANIAAALAVWLPCILLMLVLFWIVQYYQHTYGQIKASEQVRVLLLVEIVVAGLAYFFSGMINTTYHVAISVPLLALAAFLLAHWWLFARGQMHFLPLASIAIILSFAPAFNASLYHWLYLFGAPDWYYNNINICAGLILALAGVLSHWQLVRAFRQVRESIQSTSSFLSRKEDVYS
jgi:hypothetical protein